MLTHFLDKYLVLKYLVYKFKLSTYWLVIKSKLIEKWKLSSNRSRVFGHINKICK